ncbi:hypothetical protein LSAT2_006442 [Lamellibrachia satsuma]|nr:hypothetical protein LSAT2_006442 [Lamellibrachia satsuma]
MIHHSDDSPNEFRRILLRRRVPSASNAILSSHFQRTQSRIVVVVANVAAPACPDDGVSGEMDPSRAEASDVGRRSTSVARCHTPVINRPRGTLLGI